MSNSIVQPQPETAPARSLFDYVRLKTLPFFAVHGIAIAGIAWLGWSWRGLALAIASYAFRIFFVTAGYHRYFSHRSYKTSRWFQLLLAVFAQTTAQKGVLWWAAHHRDHHKFADRQGDPHSPRLRGLLHAHVGWILLKENDSTNFRTVSELNKYPELRWLNRLHLLPAVAYAVGLFLLGGWEFLLWGFFVSTVMTWHGTFTINSLTHVLGKARFALSDDSKNSWLLAVITLGEGWHNNHHFYPRATRQGFRWWEYDVTYYVLRLLAVFGVVWELHEPPARLVSNPKKHAQRKAHQGVAASLVAAL